MQVGHAFPCVLRLFTMTMPIGVVVGSSLSTCLCLVSWRLDIHHRQCVSLQNTPVLAPLMTVDRSDLLMLLAALPYFFLSHFIKSF